MHTLRRQLILHVSLSKLQQSRRKGQTLISFSLQTSGSNPSSCVPYTARVLTYSSSCSRLVSHLLQSCCILNSKLLGALQRLKSHSGDSKGIISASKQLSNNSFDHYSPSFFHFVIRHTHAHKTKKKKSLDTEKHLNCYISSHIFSRAFIRNHKDLDCGYSSKIMQTASLL